MSDVLQLGPFIIRKDWLFYGLSILLGLAVARRVILKKSPLDLQHIELISNALLIGILLWKISPIFTQPQILKNPIALLLYPGTSLGIKVAYLGAAFYLAYMVWQKKLSWRAVSDVFTVVVISSVFVFSVTHWQYGLQTTLPWGISISDPEYRYHPINVYQVLFMIPLVWYLFRLPIGQGKMASNGFVGYGISILFVSLLKPKMSSWFNLSTDQWVAVVFITIGFIFMSVQKNQWPVQEASNPENVSNANPKGGHN